MKIIQLTILSILFSTLSCEKGKSNQISQEVLKLKINELKKRDSLEIQELIKFQKIDSLSKYKVSEMEKFLDSMKINDSIKYFSLRKALEKDTLNYYEDYQLINFFNIAKMRNENEYIELAKKEILSEKNRNMNKNIILLLFLLVFALGFIIGKTTNSSGRYTYEHKNNQVAVFDSQTGKIYVKDNQYSNTKYFTIDVINGNVENYKSKNATKSK